MEEEEGQPQQNKRARAEDDGANVVLLIDESGSMEPQKQSMIPALEEALRSLGRALIPSETTVKIFCFSDAMRIVCDNTLGAIIELGLDQAAIAYEPRGSTALYDAIVSGLEHCSRSATLLVATDGANTSGHHTRESARAALRAAQDGRGVKVVWLAEGAAAAKEAEALQLPVKMRAADLSLSQALADPEVQAELSQSMAL